MLCFIGSFIALAGVAAWVYWIVSGIIEDFRPKREPPQPPDWVGCS